MAYKFLDPRDWATPYESARLEYLSHLSGERCYLLEIGAHEGRSTVWFADNILTHPDSRLLAVDLWGGNRQRFFRQFQSNINACARRRQIDYTQGNSAAVLPSLPPAFDFVYIDGSHEARDVLTDFVNSWRLLRPGGIICFDDYEWTGEGVKVGPIGQTVEIPPKPAIDAALTLWASQLNVLHKGYQVWTSKK